ncbi:hypothetical protein BHE89_20895 [Shigella sp. FC1967]|nr:hypothetical protein BHE89_20895 [Shigella sp. FC1967]
MKLLKFGLMLGLRPQNGYGVKVNRMDIKNNSGVFVLKRKTERRYSCYVTNLLSVILIQQTPEVKLKIFDK